MAPQTYTTPVECEFDKILQEVNGRLMSAHVAAIGTLEAELGRMRNENTMLRMKLAESGTATGAKGPASVRAPIKPHLFDHVGAAADLTPLPTPPPGNVQKLLSSSIVGAAICEGTVQDLDDAKGPQISANVLAVVPSSIVAGNIVPQASDMLPAAEQSDKQNVVGEQVAPAEEAVPTQESAPIVDRHSSGSPNVPCEGTIQRTTVLTVTPTAVQEIPAARAFLRATGSPAATATSLLTPIPTTLGPPVQLASSAAAVNAAQRESTTEAANLSQELTEGSVATLAPTDVVGGIGPELATQQIPAVLQSLPSVVAGKPIAAHVLESAVETIEAAVPKEPQQQQVLPSKDDVSTARSASKESTRIPSRETAEKVAESEIIEVVTPGASVLIAASGGNSLATNDTPIQQAQDLDRALETVLAFYGWQHLEVQKLSDNVFLLAGSEFMLKCDTAAEQPSSGPPCRLLASSDGGQTWESLALLIRNRRLHKVVRTAPIPATRGIPPNPDGEEGLDYDKGDVLKPQAPISLDDLARMPSRNLPLSCLNSGAREPRTSTAPGNYGGYHGSRTSPSPTAGSNFVNRGWRSATVPSTNGSPATLGPDGLPTHLQNGLPAFNNAFPTYFDALSGPTHYYNQFRIPDRQTQ